jgi:NAD(P)H-quinone oxidoreductase subunit 5
MTPFREVFPLLVAGLAGLPPLALLACGLVPGARADRQPGRMRAAVVGLAAATLAAATAAAGLLAWGGPVDLAVWSAPQPLPLTIGVWFDGLTAVMFLLIAFVGLVIARFSVRYLDGDPRQGRFFRWLAFTLGAALLLVVSRNLVMFTVAWMLTSFGLHQLLEHYADRPWAIWAARKKFLISRLGDAMLLVALGLTFWCFGSSEYGVVFAQAEALRSDAECGLLVSAIGLLYVLGAMTKSAQFPFHSWLPDTMEAPTPVSALMHAGIINAGGFLVIRLSPLISLSHTALGLLALVGAFTALFGGLVMLTQTSIKRSLAFSTIAQMGFMMLQCGLGAFSAALLHIVAHSLYKAHAFLACGSVLDGAARVKTEARPAMNGVAAIAVLPVAIGIAVALCLAPVAILGVDVTAKPGAAVLGLVMVVALTTLVWPALLSGSWRLAAAGITGGLIVSLAYVAAALGVDVILERSAVARQVLPTSAFHIAVSGLVAIGFLAVFAIQAAATTLARLPTIRSLYVHAANGFYCDIPARRLTARVWGLTAPVP